MNNDLEIKSARINKKADRIPFYWMKIMDSIKNKCQNNKYLIPEIVYCYYKNKSKDVYRTFKKHIKNTSLTITEYINYFVQEYKKIQIKDRDIRKEKKITMKLSLYDNSMIFKKQKREKINSRVGEKKSLFSMWAQSNPNLAGVDSTNKILSTNRKKSSDMLHSLEPDDPYHLNKVDTSLFKNKNVFAGKLDSKAVNTGAKNPKTNMLKQQFDHHKMFDKHVNQYDRFHVKEALELEQKEYLKRTMARKIKQNKFGVFKENVPFKSKCSTTSIKSSKISREIILNATSSDCLYTKRNTDLLEALKGKGNYTMNSNRCEVVKTLGEDLDDINGKYGIRHRQLKNNILGINSSQLKHHPYSNNDTSKYWTETDKDKTLQINSAREFIKNNDLILSVSKEKNIDNPEKPPVTFKKLGIIRKKNSSRIFRNVDLGIDKYNLSKNDFYY